VSFEVVIRRRCLDFLHGVDDKSRRIIRTRLATLGEDPYPGKRGDKELIKAPKGKNKEKVYRLHISHHFTAFYTITEKTVSVTEVLTIEQAHKKYGLL
jgi:mRNA-degrading endonuclease RelE of RelBE toxin-antitoxin system